MATGDTEAALRRFGAWFRWVMTSSQSTAILLAEDLLSDPVVSQACNHLSPTTPPVILHTPPPCAPPSIAEVRALLASPGADAISAALTAVRRRITYVRGSGHTGPLRRRVQRVQED